jgi:predicted ATPase with chaperone activity
MMISRITNFAFEARPIDLQVQLSGGSSAFDIVGLPDEAVGAKTPMAKAAEQMSLSARVYDGVLKVTRTIAGLGLKFRPASSRSRPTSPPPHRRPRGA